jgi:hypothetical protein
MQLDKVEDTKAHTTGGRPSFLAISGAAHAFRLHARFLVVLLAATACLAPSACDVSATRAMLLKAAIGVPWSRT